MNIELGRFDPNERTINVTFTEGGMVHTRIVNACIDAKGAYDPAATRERVADVARGVAVKIGLGLIRSTADRLSTS